jgi:predicted nicotinamide N-methyase
MSAKSLTSDHDNAQTWTEVPWLDAWTRWERNSKQVENDEKDEDSDDESLPPPTEQYKFTYTTPSSNNIVLKLEGYHSDSEQTWNSTGLTLWKSSNYLCQFLVDHCKELFCNELSHDDSGKQRMILEVGSGLGKCGMLAHLLSKENWKDTMTVLSDGDTDTLKLLRRNTSNNIDDDSVICRQLLWGRDHAIQFLKQHNDEQRSKFDLIIGSDLLYVRSVMQPLFETVFELLNQNDGQFLMAHCCRRVGNEVTLEELLSVSYNVGFEFREELRNGEDIVLYSFQLRDVK